MIDSTPMSPERPLPGGDRLIAYLSDVEGRWDKLTSFARDNPHVSLDAGGRLHVAPGALFVFGGDAIDRGPDGRRIVATLLDLERRQPEQTVLLAGNRDINKMRLRRELSGHPPSRTPREIASGPKGDLLRWIFQHTMGARDAFEHRRAELSREREAVTDEDVARSFLDDVLPGGALTDYLLACQLAYREGNTLFVHGAVTDESLGQVPGEPGRTGDLAAWIERLNGFYRSGIEAFVEDATDLHGEPAWSALVAYQAPLPGSRENQASVVYGRPFDDQGRPELPSLETVRALQTAGVHRLVVGHTPAGDSPALLRDEGFEIVLADNSYGRLETGSQVFVRDQAISVVSRMSVDDAVREVRFEAALADAGSPLGKRDADTGELAKGRLAGGDYILLRALGAFRHDETLEAPDALERRRLRYRT